MKIVTKCYAMPEPASLKGGGRGCDKGVGSSVISQERDVPEIDRSE